LTRGLLGFIYMAQSQDYSISLEILQYALQATGGTPMLALNDNPCARCRTPQPCS